MMPVVEVDGRVVGNGKPGPLTAKLLAAFRETTDPDRKVIPA